MLPIVLTSIRHRQALAACATSLGRFFLFSLAFPVATLATEPAAKLKPPELISVFPLGAQRGSNIELEVIGSSLEGVNRVWFECTDVRATIRRIETIEPRQGQDRDALYQAPSGDPATHRVLLDARVSPDAQLGLHGFRLITDSGMSNGLPLQVVAERVITAGNRRHQDPDDALRVTPPIVISGKLEDRGRLDFFCLEAAEQELYRFDAFSNFQPAVAYRAKLELALYDQRGSWFNPRRINRLNMRGPALSWEPMHALTRWFSKRTFPTEFVLFPRLSHRFQEPGRHLVSVGAFLGAGNPGTYYLLRIRRETELADDTTERVRHFGRPAHSDPGDWLERDSSTLRQWGSFSRPLEPDRMQLLASRSVPSEEATALPRAASLVEYTEREPNDSPRQAVTLCPPAVAAGTIGSPADIDCFRFQAAAGQQLAFEIETPRFAPPVFNPWLQVHDSDGRLLFSNIYREYGGDGDDVNKNLERKTLFTFEQAGEYLLSLRDLSLRDGGPGFAYRVLLRPQIPHVGRIEVNLDVVSESSVLVDRTDHINLVAGQTAEIILVCEMEEGFAGGVAIGAEDLPDGVELLAAPPSDRTESLLTGFQYRPPGREVMPADNYRAARIPVTIVLYARPDTTVSGIPRLVHLTAAPLLDSRAGRGLPTVRFPLMVVTPQTPAAEFPARSVNAAQRQ